MKPDAEWEKEYENIMRDNSLASSIDGEYYQRDKEQLKQFIRDLLRIHDAKLGKKAENMRKPMHKKNEDKTQQYYDAGYENGFNAAISDIQSLLNGEKV